MADTAEVMAGITRRPKTRCTMLTEPTRFERFSVEPMRWWCLRQPARLSTSATSTARFRASTGLPVVEAARARGIYVRGDVLYGAAAPCKGRR
jgi:hypothetical protein